MGLFRNILDKLGLGKDRDAYGTRPYEQAPGKPATPGPLSGQAPGSGGSGGTGSPAPATPTAGTTPAAMPRVDVMAKLEAMSASAGQKLNWKTSIVDLLKLLDLDPSLAARRELADELGAPSHLPDGSAEMNQWLHREVLRRIAENGGDLPKELLD
ncbi:DUF3597 domain-containing protein [Arenimonas composti]|nr:DUF3597 domain-containing protein [Arenimonas composti]